MLYVFYYSKKYFTKAIFTVILCLLNLIIKKSGLVSCTSSGLSLSHYSSDSFLLDLYKSIGLQD